MKLLIRHENGVKPGIMIPIPQYPLYSATIAEFDLHQVRSGGQAFDGRAFSQSTWYGQTNPFLF